MARIVPYAAIQVSRHFPLVYQKIKITAIIEMILTPPPNFQKESQN
jgi:hypothetical protein